MFCRTCFSQPIRRNCSRFSFRDPRESGMAGRTYRQTSSDSSLNRCSRQRFLLCRARCSTNRAGRTPAPCNQACRLSDKNKEQPSSGESREGLHSGLRHIRRPPPSLRTPGPRLPLSIPHAFSCFKKNDQDTDRAKQNSHENTLVFFQYAEL